MALEKTKEYQTPNLNPVHLRPHHGMCLAYFEGKGYSEGFRTHMQKMLELFTGADSVGDAECTAEAKDVMDADHDRKKGEKVLVRLVMHTDEICAACPNNEDGSCRDEEKVRKYDCSVLELCGLKDGQILEFDKFTSVVQKRILSAGRRAAICGRCQWEGICANRKSRWEF